ARIVPVEAPGDGSIQVMQRQELPACNPNVVRPRTPRIPEAGSEMPWLGSAGSENANEVSCARPRSCRLDEDQVALRQLAERAHLLVLPRVVPLQFAREETRGLGRHR